MGANEERMQQILFSVHLCTHLAEILDLSIFNPKVDDFAFNPFFSISLAREYKPMAQKFILDENSPVSLLWQSCGVCTNKDFIARL